MIPVRYWEDGATVNQWKQYVIYSDDYAKGVNFILCANIASSLSKASFCIISSYL